MLTRLLLTAVFLSHLNFASAQSITVLTADKTCYSDVVNGLATNDGLTAATPKKWPQDCSDLVASTWDLGGHTATFLNAAGQTDTYGLIFSGYRGTGSVVLDMQGGTTHTRADEAAFSAGNAHALGPIGTVGGAIPQLMIVKNTTIITDGTWGCSITNQSASFILIDSTVNFGSAPTAHMCAASPASTFGFLHGYTISGGAACHYFADAGGIIFSSDGPQTVSIINAPTFSLGFACTLQQGMIFTPKVAYSGVVHGKRFYVNPPSSINGSGTGDLNYFPGDQPGYVQPNVAWYQ